MEKILIILAPLMISLCGYTQSTGNEGMVIAQMTFSPGYSFSTKNTEMFLHGDLEYYLSDKISIRSDSYWHLFSPGQTDPYALYLDNYTGAVYHITKNDLDFGIGFQPGLAIVKLKSIATAETVNDSKAQVLPVISPSVNLAYYVHRYMHFFVNSRYAYGNGSGDGAEINQLRLSAGLGWNLKLKK